MSPAGIDIAERIKLVGKAIDQARVHVATKVDASTLKLFMLPEFFFRGKEGAYRMDDIRIVVDELQGLVKEKAKWENWVFAFGTIVGASFDPATSLADPVDTSKQVEAYNYYVVQKGGFGDGPDAASAAGHAILKRRMGPSDFIANEKTTGGLDPVKYPDPMKIGTFSEAQTEDDHEHGSVFTLENLTFGLEVCADHAEGRLKGSLRLPRIDIHLITSCGMVIVDKFIVANGGGYVFLCDGADAVCSELRKVGEKENKGQIAPLAVQPVDASGVRTDEIYPKGAGQIRIYPEQVLT